MSNVRWEYSVVQVLRTSRIEDVLNAMGRGSWQLVQVSSISPPGKYSYFVYMKRELDG